LNFLHLGDAGTNRLVWVVASDLLSLNCRRASVCKSASGSGEEGRNGAIGGVLSTAERSAADIQTEAARSWRFRLIPSMTSASAMQRIGHGKRGTGPVGGRGAKWSESLIMLGRLKQDFCFSRLGNATYCV